MQFELSSDQEFFRDTDRPLPHRDRGPVAEIRSLGSSPAGSEPTTGAKAPSWAGCRSWSPRPTAAGPSARRPRRPLSGRPRVRAQRGAGPAPAHQHRRPRALPLDQRRGANELLPAIEGGAGIATWAVTEAPPHDRLGDVALTVRVDGGDLVLDGVKRPVEAGAGPTTSWSPARTGDGPTQVLVADRLPGHHRPPDGRRRPHPALLRGPLRERARAGRRSRGRHRRRRRSGRAPRRRFGSGRSKRCCAAATAPGCSPSAAWPSGRSVATWTA